MSSKTITRTGDMQKSSIFQAILFFSAFFWICSIFLNLFPGNAAVFVSRIFVSTSIVLSLSYLVLAAVHYEK